LRDGEHEPAAEGVAVDGGDRHLGQRREPVHERRVAPGERLGLLGRDGLHLLDVVAGAEGASPAGDDEDAHVVHDGDALERLLERAGQQAIERVESLRAVEPEPGDTGVRLKVDHGNGCLESGFDRGRPAIGT